MNVFVTGGSGFIGRNIVEHFSAKCRLLAPGHRDLDLTDAGQVADFFRRHDVDVVIHGAVKPGHRNAADLSGLLDANTRMFFNLMRNAERFGKMIYLGSGAVYDMRHYQAKMPESYFDTHVPVDPHGFAKYIAAKYAERCDTVVTLRLFGVFGKYEDYAIRFISNAICKALFDLPLTIRQNRYFDYLYIDDLMPVLEHFMTVGAGAAAYNVTPDAAVDLYTIARLVLQKAGKELPIVVAEPGLGMEYSGDNALLRREIPTLTLTPLEVAIGKLYDWYAANRHLLDREKLLVDK